MITPYIAYGHYELDKMRDEQYKSVNTFHS